MVLRILKIGESKMASNSQQTKRIRANKDKPNKKNLKADRKRFEQNLKALKALSRPE
jgi:uncharacterized protein YaiI (UPF0178 family)